MRELTTFEKQINEIVPLMLDRFGARTTIGISPRILPPGFSGPFSVTGPALRETFNVRVYGSGDSPLAAWLDALRRYSAEPALPEGLDKE